VQHDQTNVRVVEKGLLRQICLLRLGVVNVVELSAVPVRGMGAEWERDSLVHLVTNTIGRALFFH
jgi:chorismate-pyruvate lyase